MPLLPILGALGGVGGLIGGIFGGKAQKRAANAQQDIARQQQQQFALTSPYYQALLSAYAQNAGLGQGGIFGGPARAMAPGAQVPTAGGTPLFGSRRTAGGLGANWGTPEDQLRLQ